MSVPELDPAEIARIRRNRLFGRIVIIALGLLVLVQMVPMILRS